MGEEGDSNVLNWQCMEGRGTGTIKIMTLLAIEITTTVHTHTTFMVILLHNAKSVGDTSVINTIKNVHGNFTRLSIIPISIMC